MPYIDKLLQRFSGKSKVNPVSIVAQRFLQLFLEHGVEAAQIPRIFPQIKLADLKSEDALLFALTPDVLDQAARLFGIRNQWLEGIGEQIYEARTCYKRPELFFEHLSNLRSDENGDFSFPIRAISITKDLDYKNPKIQLLALILVEFVTWLGDDRICRYHVYWDGWDWGYAPSRIQLKAMVRLVRISKDPVPIFTAKLGDVEKIIKGELIPRRFVDGCLITDPSLEDYSCIEGGVAKEVDELPAVFSYIEEHDLKSLIARLPTQSSTYCQLDLETQPAPAAMEQDEQSEEMPVAAAKKAPLHGIPKGAVVNAFEGLYFERDQWVKYLASPPQWLKECRVVSGKKGSNRQSSLWNPVLIAVALLDKKIQIKKLDALFVRLPEWSEAWREASENER